MMAHNGNDQHADLASLSEARKTVYTFLSGAFSEPPSERSLEALRSEQFLHSASDLFSEATLRPIREYATSARQTAGVAQQARWEFMALLKVPGARYVTPYESVFRDTRSAAGGDVQALLMGPSTVDVQKWYKLAALEISPEYKDLPDHVSLELGYLAHLCGKEQEFLSASDERKLTRAWEMERDFLSAHILPWIDALRRAIHEKTQHPYYRAVADLAVEFTRRDHQTLENVIGPRDGGQARILK